MSNTRTAARFSIHVTLGLCGEPTPEPEDETGLENFISDLLSGRSVRVNDLIADIPNDSRDFFNNERLFNDIFQIPRPSIFDNPPTSIPDTGIPNNRIIEIDPLTGQPTFWKAN